MLQSFKYHSDLFCSYFFCSGPDGIPALVLRNAAAELASPLARLFSCASTKNICRHSGRWRM